jgi:hypothetical protein
MSRALPKSPDRLRRARWALALAVVAPLLWLSLPAPGEGARDDACLVATGAHQVVVEQVPGMEPGELGDLSDRGQPDVVVVAPEVAWPPAARG